MIKNGAVALLKKKYFPCAIITISNMGGTFYDGNPTNHLLRQIKNGVSFDFIYEKAAPYYSHTDIKSIVPVVMIKKMLLIGYLYGIKYERRLEEEVSLNLAYRWFCELALTEKFPTTVHSARTDADVLKTMLFLENIQQSSIHYLDELEKEMSQIAGYKPPSSRKVTKRSLKSSTAPDCGYINQKNKKELGYLTEITVDTSHGIITGVDC